MKHRVISITVVLVGICFGTPMAHARPDSFLPQSGTKSGNPDLLSPLSGEQWKTPVATVNPEVLIPDDSTNARPGGLFDSHSKSSFGANAFPSANAARAGNSQVEASKPIEKIEAHNDDALSDPPVAAAPIPRSDSKRVVIVAIASVALLAFRKFRRPKAALPPKPSFL